MYHSRWLTYLGVAICAPWILLSIAYIVRQVLWGDLEPLPWGWMQVGRPERW